jgi:hypothetical protein
MILLPQPPECWDYRGTLPHLVSPSIFNELEEREREERNRIERRGEAQLTWPTSQGRLYVVTPRLPTAQTCLCPEGEVNRDGVPVKLTFAHLVEL